MKNESWICDMLQKNEDLCRKNKLTALDLEKLRDDYFPMVDHISRDLIIRALFTVHDNRDFDNDGKVGLKAALRKVLLRIKRLLGLKPTVVTSNEQINFTFKGIWPGDRVIRFIFEEQSFIFEVV